MKLITTILILISLNSYSQPNDNDGFDVHTIPTQHCDFGTFTDIDVALSVKDKTITPELDEEICNFIAEEEMRGDK